MRRELAQAVAALAAQQQKAVAARARVQEGVAAVRGLMARPGDAAALRGAHADLLVLRARSAHEDATVLQLDRIAAERRADLVRASQEKQAVGRLRERALARHAAEELRRDAAAMDELALRRARRGRGVAA